MIQEIGRIDSADVSVDHVVAVRTHSGDACGVEILADGDSQARLGEAYVHAHRAREQGDHVSGFVTFRLLQPTHPSIP